MVKKSMADAEVIKKQELPAASFAQNLKCQFVITKKISRKKV